MSKEEATLAAPVRIRGIVIESESNSFVIHDGDQGIYVLAAEEIVPSFGQDVVVEGTSDPGDFAPIIKAEGVTVVGEGTLAPRVISDLEQLETGTLDCQWAVVEGELRSARPPSSAVPCFSAYATLTAGSVQLKLSFSQTSYAEVKKWVGARVRLQVAWLHYFNPHGQLFGAHLVVPRTDEVEVLELALPREEVPLARIDSLLRYSPQKRQQGRARIRGVVTYSRGDAEFYVQQDQRGIYVQNSAPQALAVGDVVDVVGFVRRGVYSPEIEDAETELVGRQETVRARSVSAREAKASDSQLVEVSGILLDQVRRANFSTLTVKGEGALFTAEVPMRDEYTEIPAEIGSLVQLTGVVRILSVPLAGSPFPWEPDTFELRLRNADDLRVLKRPAIGLVVWAFGLAAATTSIALLIAGTLWYRSKAKLREQRRQRLAREVEFATTMKERMRLAREIHDSLAQGFAAVSIQLENAKHKLPPEATVARNHIETARALVRDSLAEARRSIQGLRRETLSNAEFAAALRRSSERILKDTSLVYDQTLEGDIAQLGVEAEDALLRIATEAMTNTVKHAQAKRIHLTCRVRDGYGELNVSDDGAGYNRSDPVAGFGLRGMKERTLQLNGHLEIFSKPGQGTRISARIPLSDTPCKAPRELSGYSS